MINERIEKAEPFGLLCMREGSQEETEHTILRVGVTARIVEVERLDAGRMNVLCQGESRIRVLRFVQNQPYWRGTVELFEDAAADPDQTDPLYVELSDLFRKALDLSARLNPERPRDQTLPQSASDLSFMAGYVLDIPPEEKQRLLEMTSTVDRLEAVIVHTGEAITALEKQLAYKDLVNKVRGNGDLGKPGSQ
jgi:Lon protease-like protein